MKALTLAVCVTIIAALIIGTCGCTSSNVTQTPAAQRAVNGVSGQSSNTVEGMEFYATPVANPPQTLGVGYTLVHPGDVYVAFNCTVKDVSASPLPGASQKYISDGYWNLVDKNGNIYYPVPSVVVSETPGITAFGVHYASPGDVVNGYVFFEVPANHSAWNYIYYDDGGGHAEVPL